MELMQQGPNELITLPIGKALWILAVPMMLESIVITLLNLTDMFWVGKLGHEALAAAGIVGMLMVTVSSIASGLSIGMTAILARRFCEGDTHSAAEAWLNGIVVGFIVGIIATALMYIFEGPLLQFFNPEPAVMELAKQYYFWIFLARPLFFVSVICVGSLRGAGRPKMSLIANAIGVGLNIFLDPILIFGLLGFPKMGVTGAALATAISEALAMTILVFNCKSVFVNVLVKPIRVKLSLMLHIIKIGLPSSMQTFVRFVGASALMWIVARFGTATVAAFTVTTRAQEFITLPVIGMGNAVATLVGQNLGAGRPDRAEQTVWRSVLYNTSIVVALTAVFTVFSTPIIGLFNNHPDVLAVGQIMVVIISISNVIFPLGSLPLRGLNGAGDTVTAMLISIGILWVVQVPLCFMMSLWVGHTGIWWGINIGGALMAALSVFIFRLGKWKSIKV